MYIYIYTNSIHMNIGFMLTHTGVFIYICVYIIYAQPIYNLCTHCSLSLSFISMSVLVSRLRPKSLSTATTPAKQADMSSYWSSSVSHTSSCRGRWRGCSSGLACRSNGGRDRADDECEDQEVEEEEEKEKEEEENNKKKQEED